MTLRLQCFMVVLRIKIEYLLQNLHLILTLIICGVSLISPFLYMFIDVIDDLFILEMKRSGSSSSFSNFGSKFGGSPHGGGNTNYFTNMAENGENCPTSEKHYGENTDEEQKTGQKFGNVDVSGHSPGSMVMEQAKNLIDIGFPGSHAENAGVATINALHDGIKTLEENLTDEIFPHGKAGVNALYYLQNEEEYETTFGGEHLRKK